MGSLNPSHCKIFFRKELTPRGGVPAGKGFLPFDWSNQFKEDYEVPEPKMSEEDVYLTGRGRDVSLVQYGGFKVGEGSVSFEILSGIFLYYALGQSVTTIVNGYQKLGLTGIASGGDPSTPNRTYLINVVVDGGTAVEYSIVASSTDTWTKLLGLLNVATLGKCSWFIDAEDVKCISAPLSVSAGSSVDLLAGLGLTPVPGTIPEVPAGNYQDLGLADVDDDSTTSLSAQAYKIKLAVNGAAAVEYTITAILNMTHTALIALLNTATQDVAQWSIVGGDIRCTLTGLIRFSSIAITSAGTTGENPTSLLAELSSTPATAVQGYFLHTISGADSLPTMTQYMEQLFATPLYTQGKGIIVKSWEITYELGNETPVGCNVDIMIPEVVTTTVQTNPTPANFSKERFVFPNVYTLSLTYASSEITITPKELSGDATYGLKRLCNKCSIKIENEIDYVNVMGDDYPQRIKIGKRMVTFSTDVEIQNSQWYKISRLRTPNFTTEYGTTGFFAGIIAFSSLLKRNNWDHDSISIALNYVQMDKESFNNKFPSWESKVFEMDIGWKMAPLCTPVYLIKDDLPKIYYEDD
jgi:hypothetical protein